MFQMKPIARQILLACGGVAGALLLAVPAQAQQQQQPPAAQSTQKLDRVEVTGTNIRRTDTETVSPVIIITRDEIERSGKATIADLLRDLPINSQGSFNELRLNSFATGGASLSLRGLGPLGTLLLINGRRTANFGFADNLTETFVDLNQMPTSAVDRIEILKDGASAIYGSDAIAGVVNIIFRRDFKGFEVTARSSAEAPGKLRDYAATLTGGIGDLGANGFNAFAVIDYYKRDGNLRKDYPLTQSNDFSRFFAGDDQRGSTGGTWRAVSTGGLPVTLAQSRIRVPTPNCPTELIPASRLSSVLTGTSCAGDIGPGVTTLIPDQERISLLSRATLDFSANLQGYAEINLSKVETESLQDYNYLTVGATVFRATPTSGGRLIPQQLRYLLPPTAPGNPFNGTGGLPSAFAEFLVPSFDLGVNRQEATSTNGSLLVGLKGTHFGWDWDAGIGAAQAKAESSRIGPMSISGLLGSATGSASDGFVLINGVLAGRGGFQPAGSNSAAIVNSIRRTLNRESKSEYSGIDFKASREIYNLPAGPVGMAVGLEFRREKLNDVPDPQLLSGDILNFGSTRTNGKRDADSQFIEFSIPLTAQIESQVAARRDNYSDFGSKITPKVGVKFKPSQSFLIRANHSQGFRAPSLPQNSNSDSTAFASLFDYAGCFDAAGRPTGAVSACQGFFLGTGTSTGVVFQGNPALKPETSKSTTLGLLFAPSADTSMSFDWYQIDWRNIVSAIDTNAELFKEYLRNVVGVPGITINPGVQFFRSSADGALIGVTNQFSNLDRTRTSGFDVAYQQRFATGYGRLGLQLDATYVASFETSSPSVDDDGNDILDTTELAGRNSGSLSAFPRWRGRASADLERGDFNFRLAANYVGSYRQGAITTNFRGERRPTKIEEYATYDLGVTYRFSRQLTAIVAVRNIFDAIVPFDPRMTQLGFAADQYAPVRRQIVLNGRYRF